MDVANIEESYGIIKGEVMAVVINVHMFSLLPSLPVFLQVRCSYSWYRHLHQGGSCHGSEDRMLMTTLTGSEIGSCTRTGWSNLNTDQGLVWGQWGRGKEGRKRQDENHGNVQIISLPKPLSTPSAAGKTSTMWREKSQVWECEKETPDMYQNNSFRYCLCWLHSWLSQLPKSKLLFYFAQTAFIEYLTVEEMSPRYQCRIKLDEQIYQEMLGESHIWRANCIGDIVIKSYVHVYEECVCVRVCHTV